MKDTIVSVAELKARLSAYLADSRSQRRRIIVTNRRRPIAVITPVSAEVGTVDSPSGLAALAGAWPDFHEIQEGIEQAYLNRQADGYRAIPL